MKHPLDSSDEASLILADYLEEHDNINLANEVRNSILEPNTNVWCYDYFGFGGVFGAFGVVGGSFDRGIVGSFSGVGSGFNVGGGFGGLVGK